MHKYYTLACTLAFSTLSVSSFADDTGKQRELAYRNAVNPPPADWNGPVFQLSDDYPTTLRTCTDASCPWLDGTEDMFKVDFSRKKALKWNSQWQGYINKIFNYIREGQTNDLNNDTGFRTQVNGQTRWFSVPWMAYDPTVGREFVHGLTNERTALLDDFYPSRKHMHGGKHAVGNNQNGFETWAVGYYNDIAAYSIGKAWSRDGAPVKGQYNGLPSLEGLPFAEGSVVVKLLFSTASPQSVPYLKGSPRWTANRHVENADGFSCERQPQDVYLVQMDVAVVDKNSPTNWVYGTYAYNGDSKHRTSDIWSQLEPVGLQWGMDPWTFPAVPKSESITARQSVLNHGAKDQHYGCNGRLAGPVDNRQSSCLSCHGGSFATSEGQTFFNGPFSPPVFGFDGLCEQYSQDNVNAFQTIRFPMNYSGGQYEDLLNLDTSLQMQIAFQQWNYFTYQGQPVACNSN